MVFPGMLNMTSVKISMERGKLSTGKFAFGVSIVVFIQAYLAIIFIKYLKENPEFITSLQKFAFLIFSILSFYFFKEFKKESKNTTEFTQKCKDTFVIGLFLSALNMFAIPFYYGITSILKNADLIQLSQNNILLFVLGSAAGSFLLLYSYPNFAKKIQRKSGRSADKLNLVLSMLTGVLALITFIKIV